MRAQLAKHICFACHSNMNSAQDPNLIAKRRDKWKHKTADTRPMHGPCVSCTESIQKNSIPYCLTAGLWFAAGDMLHVHQPCCKFI